MSELLNLGGVDQFVTITGIEPTKPILLILHGGPGDPGQPIFDHYCPQLRQDFVVVHWDQRGSGRSHLPADAFGSVTVEQLIADAAELTSVLRTRFPDQPIVVLGHSWGSYLGARLVHRRPDLFAAFVGVGQVVDQAESETRGFEWAVDEAQRRGSRRATRALKSLGPPERGRYRNGLSGMGTQRRWIRAFGGAAHGRGNLAVLWMFAWPLLRCRDYGLRDTVRYLRSQARCMEQLQEPMLDDPLQTNVRTYEVPFLVIQGRHDRQTDAGLAIDYVAGISAPAKQIVILENVAHLAPFEDPKAFAGALNSLLEPHLP